MKYKIVSPYCPNIVLASILIFLGFSFLRLRESRLVMEVSEISFIIYLFHAGVWDFIAKLFCILRGKNFWESTNCLYMIPIFVGMVFAGSYLMAKIYNKIYSKISIYIMPSLLQ